MINGSTEWVDGDGFTSGAEPLLEEIRPRTPQPTDQSAVAAGRGQTTHLPSNIGARAEPARNGGGSGFLPPPMADAR